MSHNNTYNNTTSGGNRRHNTHPHRTHGEECLYGALGLDASGRSTITSSDIKRAYKAMAMRHHPDRHASSTAEARAAAEAQFKAAGRAFEVLSDERARRQYDAGGLAAVHNHHHDTPHAEDATGPNHHNPRPQQQARPRQSSTSHDTSAFRHHDDLDDDPFAAFFGRGAGGGSRGGATRTTADPFGFGFGFSDPFDVFRRVFGDISGHAPTSEMRRNTNRRSNDMRMMHEAMLGLEDPFHLPHLAGHHSHGHHANHANTHANAHARMMQGGGLFGGGGLMDDDFGMGMGMGGMMAAMMMGGGGLGGLGGLGGGTSSSVSVTTTIVNGQKVTKRIERRQDARGNVTEESNETVEALGGMGGGGVAIGGGSRRPRLGVTAAAGTGHGGISAFYF